MTHMYHTSDTLYFKEYNLVIKYFKEYNLVIKYGLLLKIELTGSVDACLSKITMPCIYFNKL